MRPRAASWWWRLVLILTAIAATGGRAAAQGAQEPDSDPVAEAPFRLWAAGVAPSLAITNLGVDTNVFNSTTDPRRDFTLTVTPGSRLWLRTARGLLSLEGHVDLVYFATYASERSANTAATIGYEYPFLRVRPFVSYSMLGTRERPGYEIDARARRFEDDLRVGAAIPIGSLTSLEVARRHEGVTFDGDAVFGEQPLKQSLDRTLDAWDVTWRQPLTVLTTWVAGVAREQERFAFEPGRNSNSFRVSSGFELGLLALVRGRAFVGYRRLTSAEGGTLADFGGVTADVDVSYTAPSQTRVALVMNRDLQYSLDLDYPYYVQTGWTLVATQRIFGRWDVQVTGGGDRLAYQAAGVSTDRLDRIRRLGSGVGYDVGDSVRVGFDMLWQVRQSPLLARDYRAFKSGVSVTYGY